MRADISSTSAAPSKMSTRNPKGNPKDVEPETKKKKSVVQKPIKMDDIETLKKTKIKKKAKMETKPKVKLEQVKSLEKPKI